MSEELASQTNEYVRLSLGPQTHPTVFLRVSWHRAVQYVLCALQAFAHGTMVVVSSSGQECAGHQGMKGVDVQPSSINRPTYIGLQYVTAIRASRD